MNDGFAHVYNVGLLCKNLSQIDSQEVLSRLRQHCGRVEPLSKTPELLSFVFPDYATSYYGGKPMLAQVMIARSEKPPDMAALEVALSQTWDWPEAHERVERSQATLMVSDFMSSGLDYRARLTLFHNVVTAALHTVECQAIHWQPARRVVDPQRYIALRQSEQSDPLFPAFEVRLFRIKNRTPGETVMDTLGLAALGLPDVQCHFTELNYKNVGRVLYNMAYYLFEHGDIVRDGDTIQGTPPDQYWVCTHEKALIEPERMVLDINPGAPFAAGERE